ncbi:MAG: hypothetical protein WA274_16725, partial [Candidatus Acidiferrales bacterium]
SWLSVMTYFGNISNRGCLYGASKCETIRSGGAVFSAHGQRSCCKHGPPSGIELAVRNDNIREHRTSASFKPAKGD